MALKRADEDQVRPYKFTPAFERACVVLACTSVEFYGKIGHELDPKGLADDGNRLALEAARAIARELGHGPASGLLVVQRLARWREDGKVTHQQVLDADEMLERGESERHDPGAFARELVPLLRLRVHEKATRGLMEAVGKNDDLEIAKVEAELARARGLGAVDTDIGTLISGASYAEIEAARHMDRLSFAIPELDTLLDGGPPRGSLTVVLGDQKSGKSIFCSHTVANCMLRGQFTMYASLEVPRPAVLARIKANLTNVPTNTLLRGDTAESRRVFAEIAGRMGPCYVKKFPSKHTTINDLKAWVAKGEHALGRKVDVVVVDYMDKCRATSVSGKSGRDGLYQGMSEVYEDGREWAESSGFWMISPSQSRGRDTQRGKHKGQGGGGTSRDILDMGDEADSVEKSRIADLFLTLNPRDEGKSTLIYVAGNRHGEARRGAGPVPVDYACGRIGTLESAAPVPDEW